MELYLDNSATSWPKPVSVVEAISRFMTECGASPGRSGHKKAIEAARMVYETREMLRNFFNADTSDRVVFTQNLTLAMNIALKGILKKGDHVIISHTEHNSVIRPLRHLENQGLIEISVVPCNSEGQIDLEAFSKTFKPNTKLVACIHGSNVSGAILPIEKIGEMCKARNVLFVVDAAQTAGFLPIDMKLQNIDVLTFTGHKKLYGPTGIGGLCFNENVKIDNFIQGGSGSKSEAETHPDFYPDKLEAGTLNTIGIVGLKAGLEYILGKGIDNIRKNLLELTEFFIKSLIEIPEITVHGPSLGKLRLPVISVSTDLMFPDKLSQILDTEYGIMTRHGLHCSPLAHKALGTFPYGTTRFSLGCFNTQDDVEFVVNSLKQILCDKKI
ncbi:MAG TPA: aminotransferase class V-fold PLP-dependent enzyme [Bacteroidetes bacterium]|nr:aminotransferase class V-fold PLP-dependent enzyme [Bacteroidota bacterium]